MTAKVSPPPERGHLIERLDLVNHRGALALQEIGDGAAEAGVGDIMGGEGGDGPVAARQLVPALRARLGALQAAGDDGVDRLVVAKLEMEEGQLGQSAPVAAVKRLGADHVER